MIKVLATDLDGTLIPMSEDARPYDSLQALTDLVDQRSMQWVFVTGRHLDFIEEAIRTYHLPVPRFIVANVGTEIYQFDPAWVCESSESAYRLVSSYHAELQRRTLGIDATSLVRFTQHIHGLTVQEPEKLSEHKLSFYSEGHEVDRLVGELNLLLNEESLPFDIVSSIDPLDGRGLIDLLPQGVNKCFALDWWSHWQSIPPTQIIYSGDSGNDLHALTAGYHSIVVGNAPGALKEKVARLHQQRHGHQRRLYLATQPATCGVLEGLRHFLGQTDIAQTV